MSTISNLGNRGWPASLYGANQPKDSRTSSANGANALQKPQDASPVSLSSDALDLQKRVASMGNATVDFAQNFVNSFAQSLFGDDAKGATISFDSASLDVSSTLAAGVQHTEDANGVTDAAALSLTDSSHFIGKGTITTADGRKFDFEVEVQYDDELDAAASQTQSAGDQPPSTDQAGDKPQAANGKDLPTAQLPNVDFAGTLADLLKLVGRELKATLADNGNGNQQPDNNADRGSLRNLTLRLLKLADSKDSNTYAPPAASAPAAADTAGTPPVSATAPAADTGAGTSAPGAPSTSTQPSA